MWKLVLHVGSPRNIQRSTIWCTTAFTSHSSWWSWEGWKHQCCRCENPWLYQQSPVLYISNLIFSGWNGDIVLPCFQQYLFSWNMKLSLPPQVNTLAAEKLYSLAGDWACLGPDTLLFDICCGTGAIGLTLAHRVGMVIITS